MTNSTHLFLVAAAKAGHDSGSHLPLAALLTAAVALVVAISNALYSQYVARRDRRRDLYSEAYRAAMSWVEMIYRVRRRSSDPKAEDELVNHFHELQETISYYEGWLETEAPELARSYCKLVAVVRAEAGELIRQAWAEQPRPRAEPRRADDNDPNVREARDAFLRDAREHLSPWWWVRRRVKDRNPPSQETS